MGLLGIEDVISPDLLHAMCSMGHGDEIVFADIHFPAASIAATHGAKLIRLDGHSLTRILPAVLKLFPLDSYVPQDGLVMQKVPQDADKEIPIWKVFQEELHKAKQAPVVLKQIERFAFYERAKQAFAVVATGERSQYGNLILTKGICP